MKTLIKGSITLLFALAVILGFSNQGFSQLGFPDDVTFEYDPEPDPIWVYYICVDEEGYEVDCEEEPPEEPPEDPPEEPEDPPEIVVPPPEPPLQVPDIPEEEPAEPGMDMMFEGSGTIFGCSIDPLSSGSSPWSALAFALLGLVAWIPVIRRPKK